MRIFLDANILFSAAKSAGAIRELLSMISQRGHALVADAYVIEEARRNLAAKAPGQLAVLEHLVAGMDVLEAAAAIGTSLPELPLPEKDRPVLIAAIRGRCTILVTGDRTHFGKLFRTRVHGVTVHSPQSLAEAILG